MASSLTIDPGLLAACVADIGLGVAIFDPDQKLVYRNGRFAELMGLPEELLREGTHYIDIIRHNRARGVINEGDASHGAERRLTPSDGKRRPYRTTLLLPSGDVITMQLKLLPKDHFMVTYRRVTRRRKAEIKAREALERAHAAAREAEFANRSKTEFLANMSHELRTPLNAIIGFADVLSHEIKGPLGTPEYVEYASHIGEAGRHLLEIINDLLDIAKIEAGKIDLRDETVDLGRTMHACINLLAGRANDGGIELAIGPHSDAPAVRADARMIKQILLNLVSNAVKFTPPGGRVTMEARRESDGSATIIVADTGIGIAADDIARALTRFTQIENTLGRRYEGTGLGLPLAKSLVELHGGTLDIASAPGHGTAVTVRLPPDRVSTRAA